MAPHQGYRKTKIGTTCERTFIMSLFWATQSDYRIHAINHTAPWQNNMTDSTAL